MSQSCFNPVLYKGCSKRLEIRYGVKTAVLNYEGCILIILRFQNLTTYGFVCCFF